MKVSKAVEAVLQMSRATVTGLLCQDPFLISPNNLRTRLIPFRYVSCRSLQLSLSELCCVAGGFVAVGERESRLVWDRLVKPAQAWAALVHLVEIQDLGRDLLHKNITISLALSFPSPC